VVCSLALKFAPNIALPLLFLSREVGDRRSPLQKTSPLQGRVSSPPRMAGQNVCPTKGKVRGQPVSRRCVHFSPVPCISYHFAFQGMKPAGFLRSAFRSSVRSGGGALPARQGYLFEREMVSQDSESIPNGHGNLFTEKCVAGIPFRRRTR
jgi:hypothetical protein